MQNQNRNTEDNVTEWTHWTAAG